MPRYTVHIIRCSKMWEEAFIEVEAEDSQAAVDAANEFDDDDLDYDEVEKTTENYRYEAVEKA